MFQKGQVTRIEGVTAFQILELLKFEQFRETKLFKQLSPQKNGVNSESGVSGVKYGEITTPKNPATPQDYREQEINQELDFSKTGIKEALEDE